MWLVISNMHISCLLQLGIGNLLQKSLIDSSSDEGLKPDDMNGTVELKNVMFHYPSREEVPVISDNVFTSNEQ